MVAPSQKDGAGPQDKLPPPDWSEIYGDLVCHTSTRPLDIPDMTIPQIQAIRNKLGKNIAIKVGMPSLFGGALDTPAPSSTGKPPKLSEFMNFANMFNGM